MREFLLARLLPATLVAVVFSPALLAQPGNGGSGSGGSTAVPIDGGVSLLLAGGVAYGVRRLRDRREK